MPFPKIQHCIVCDDLRQETAKKTTILGFFGIAPNVEVLVQDLNQPIGRLSFLLVGGPGEGKYKVLPRLLDNDGNAIIEPKEAMEVSFKGPGKISILGFGFAPIKFPAAGTYKLELMVDGQRQYETTFSIGQGKPEDFV